MSLKKDRLAPQALDAEMAVLGSMLIDRDAIDRTLDILDAKHFYSGKHQLIYNTIRSMFDRNIAVDMVTIVEELKGAGKLAEAGSEVYLSEIIDKVSSSANVTHYAKIVRQKATIRELINSATSIIEDCYNSSETDNDELIDKAQERIYEISQKQDIKGFSSSKEIVQTVMEQLEKANLQRASVTGVPSGFVRLDSMTGGFQKSDFIIIAARPSQGKTALALNIAHHVAVDKGLPVAIFSIEMSKDSIAQRMICAAAMADVHKVRTGFLPRNRWSDLMREMSRLGDSPLFIDDSSGLTITEMRMKARRLATELKRQGKDLGLIIIDYIQLINSSTRKESRQQEVSEISRRVKDLARTLDVPVIALSQLSRKSEDSKRTDNRPVLSDLRDSGSLEQDADLVALIHREEYYKRDDPSLKGQAELIVAKHRNGPVGTVSLNFISEYTRFTNPVPENMSHIQDEEVFPS